MARKFDLRTLPKRRVAEMSVSWRAAARDNSPQLTINALRGLVDNNGEGINDLMREVIYATLMNAYSERFLKARPIMRRLIVGDPEISAKKQAFYLVRLREAENRLNRAQQGSDEYYRAKASVTRFTYAYTGRRPPKEAMVQGKQVKVGDETYTEVRKSLFDELRESGAFGDRMTQVFDRFRSEAGMRKTARADTVQVSFGNINLMDSVQTSPRTDSKMNIMWRQLEFGSGAYMKEAGNTVGKPRVPGTWMKKAGRYSKEYIDVDPVTGDRKRVALTDGSWMMGGLRILGSRPGNWLREASGAPYTKDAQLYYPVFFARLSQALNRRR